MYTYKIATKGDESMLPELCKLGAQAGTGKDIAAIFHGEDCIVLILFKKVRLSTDYVVVVNYY